MTQRLFITILMTCLTISASTGTASPGNTHGSVSVLHWWTSPSESKAAEILKEHFSNSNYIWLDQPVAGGGGNNAMTVLKSQVISGNPPLAAQIRGQGIRDWASLDLLAPVDGVANRSKWNSVLPKFVADTMQFRGLYYGVPLSLHRNNWLWINPKAFEQTGLAVPFSWDDLIAIAPRLRREGFIPLTHGGEPWQQATIFESLVLAEGGADFYKQALVKHDREALTSETMVRVFRKLKQIASLVPQRHNRLSWEEATREVIDNKAAMILMGDWALGEFKLNDKEVIRDFLCVPAFGTEGQFIYNIDSFVMFHTRGFKDRQAQLRMSTQLMNKETQIAFSEHKGSIPVRMDAVDHLEGCQKQSYTDLKQSIEANTLVPSIIHGMAMKESLQMSLINFVSHYMSNPGSVPEEAVKSLPSVLQAPSNTRRSITQF